MNERMRATGGESRLNGRHPSFVFLTFLLLGFLPFLFQDPRFLGLIYLADLLLILWLGWPRSLRMAYLLVGGVGGLFTAVSWLPFTTEGFAYWRGEIPLIGYPLQITDTGILWALGMGLRIATVALLSMYYLFVTSPRQIAMGLRGIGLPFSLGFLLSLIFRFIPLVKHDLATIREAQMVRGMQLEKGSVVQQIRTYSSLLVPLIFTSLRRVQLMANALDAKGFRMRGGQHRFYRMPRWQPWEAALIAGGVLLAAGLFYLARVHPAGYGILLPGRI